MTEANKNRTLLWCIYFDSKHIPHAFEFTEEEKEIPIKDVLENLKGKEAMFITMQTGFTEEEVIRKFSEILGRE